MKLTLLGSNGMLGYAVQNYFKSLSWNVHSLTRNEFDIAKDPFQKFENLMFQHSPDLVINAAGVIKPMIAKNSTEDVLKVNSIFPHNLAKWAISKKIKCVHITTDCVYSGTKGLYTEDDYFDATDVYGMSKNAGEPKEIMTLRTSIIGEEKPPGRSLLAWAQSQTGKEVNGFTNHLWNGLTTTEVAKTIHSIIEKKLYSPGLFHLHSAQPVTKFELLKCFNDTYHLNLKINATSANEIIDRSLSSRYSLSKELVTSTIPDQIKWMNQFFRSMK